MRHPAPLGRPREQGLDVVVIATAVVLWYALYACSAWAALRRGLVRGATSLLR